MYIKLGPEIAEHFSKHPDKQRQLFSCRHVHKRQYAKNMCHTCYHEKGKTKMADKCSHVNKPHYSAGLCQSCYLA